MPTYLGQRSSIPQQRDYLINYDDRNYEGFHQFNEDQVYEGEFLRNSFHGQGTYKWHGVGVYEGRFFCNCKEGYASVSLPDNSYFEGLFISNQPFGPGIFTHSNGRQDAGFWKGRKLVRLSRPVDFIIPRLAPTSAAKIKLLQFRRLIPLDEDTFSTDILLQYGLPLENFPHPYSGQVYDRRSVFFDRNTFEKAYFSPQKTCTLDSPGVEQTGEMQKGRVLHSVKENPTPSHCLCQDEVFVMRYESQEKVDICVDRSSLEDSEKGILAFFSKQEKEEEEGGECETELEMVASEKSITELEKETTDKKSRPKIVSWNRSELCTEMLKQIFRFRDFEGKLTFNLTKLMVGARTDFRKTGENEMHCLQFLKMCSLGPAHVVKSILCSYEISEELMDGRGNNSLMFAAATDQHDVIEVLLNYGVTVNTFNDEGLTPLNLCLLRRLAQANGISSWETAFLPKEIDEIQENDSHTQEYPAGESISSLDRIFGDGMSVNDSNVLGLESRETSPIQSPPRIKESVDRHHNTIQESKESLRNRVTTSSTLKSQGSFSIINWEWDFRVMNSSVGLISNPTPLLNVKIVPNSVRRDEFQRSIQKTKRDKYLFELTFENRLNGEGETLDKGKYSRNEIEEEEVEEEEEGENTEFKDAVQDNKKWSSDLSDISEKISKIDKTISLLLRRGADTNISEVPKPSIHLGIYTKDFNIVHNLLSHGANPNSQLHSNEGLLTPLHVIVLQESSPENYSLCGLLLNFKANPDKETHPEFSLYEDEKQYLDPEHGRTPLQLLCMRPDLEYADKSKNLLNIGFLLAKSCNRKCFYNGHSYLTLAMLFGNVKLLGVLLHSRFFDAREILGKNRGTCLHVLVSSELQKRTPYETSMKMCKLLLRAGADPSIRFSNPKCLFGTCVDYGLREIQAEKEARRASVLNGNMKKYDKSRKEKLGERDFLRDHERVVEYLASIVKKAKKKRSVRQSKDSGNYHPWRQSYDSYGESVSQGKSSGKYDMGITGEDFDMTGEGYCEIEGENYEEDSFRAGEPSDEKERFDFLQDEEVVGKRRKISEKEEGKHVSEKKKHGTKARSVSLIANFPDVKGNDRNEWKKHAKKVSISENLETVFEKSESAAGKRKSVAGKRESVAGKRKSVAGKRESVAVKSESVAVKSESVIGKRESVAVKSESVIGKRESVAVKSESVTGKRESVAGKRKSVAGKHKSVEEESMNDERKRTSIGGKRRSTLRNTESNVSRKMSGDRDRPSQDMSEKGKRNTIISQSSEEDRESDTEIRKTKDRGGVSRKAKESIASRGGKLQTKRRERMRGEKANSAGKKASRSAAKITGRESDLLKRGMTSLKSLGNRNLSSSEVFPEKLRQLLLRLYGNCSRMDVNEFLMPYVVLRDGELYYKFKGKATKQKEQYSLV